MRNTILSGNKIFLAKIFKVKKGDIVLINTNNIGLSRAVALPGDTLEIRNSILYINNKEVKYQHQTQQFNIFSFFNTQKKATKHKDTNTKTVTLLLDSSEHFFFKKNSSFYIKKQITEADYSSPNIFPHSYRFRWNRDNFGPVIIPQKGKKIKINADEMRIYKNTVKKTERKNSYEFIGNYYFILNDNRSDINNSLKYGFVKSDNIKGKVIGVMNY